MAYETHDGSVDPREALDALEYIDPTTLSQGEWQDASMAANAAGIDYPDWDEWCQRDDERYDKRENRRRWESFDPSGGKTARTLFQMAYKRGWIGRGGGTKARANRNDHHDQRNTQTQTNAPRLVLPAVDDVTPPTVTLESAREVPVGEQLRNYLRALHDSGAHVAVVAHAKSDRRGKYRPDGRGELYAVEELSEHPDKAFDKADRAAGAWIALNEYDPERFEADGRKQTALSSFRYALIEADEDEDGRPIPFETQLLLAARLRLPVRAVVWSGAKSLHLVCRVDAKDPGTFRERARLMVSVCVAGGFHVDESVTDPVRLSRLPGAMRDGQQQTLVWAWPGTDGKGDCWTASWGEWRAWIDENSANGERDQGELRHAGGGNAPLHRRMANVLLDDCGACIIDGIPAVREGQTYSHEGGWTAWDRALVIEFPNSRTRDRSEAIALARCECRRVRQAAPKYVAFRNGVLNVATMELDARGSYRILNVLPHDWNPDAASPELDAALEAWADGDAPTVARLEECAGHCLDRSSELQFFWVLVGEGGNGKSLFTRTIGNAIGAANYSAVQPDELDKRFQGLSIAGKLACLADDASSQAMTAGMVATLKRYTGGATVRSDVKGRDAIEFLPYASVLMSFNRFPRVTGCDGGFMRRLQPIVFSHTFGPGDGGMKATRALMDEAAAERLLVRAVDGLSRLRTSGEPTPSAKARRVVDEVRTENDSFEAWRIDEEITGDFIDGKRQSEVLANYLNWCERERETPLSNRKFYDRVKREWRPDTAVKKIAGKSTKVYRIQ